MILATNYPVFYSYLHFLLQPVKVTYKHFANNNPDNMLYLCLYQALQAYNTLSQNLLTLPHTLIVPLPLAPPSPDHQRT